MIIKFADKEWLDTIYMDGLKKLCGETNIFYFSINA